MPPPRRRLYRSRRHERSPRGRRSASGPPLRELRRLLPYVRPHRAALIGSGVAALTATLAGLAIPLVTRAIVDGPVARGELGTLPWLVLGVLAFGASKPG